MMFKDLNIAPYIINHDGGTNPRWRRSQILVDADGKTWAVYRRIEDDLYSLDPVGLHEQGFWVCELGYDDADPELSPLEVQCLIANMTPYLEG